MGDSTAWSRLHILLVKVVKLSHIKATGKFSKKIYFQPLQMSAYWGEVVVAQMSTGLRS